MDGVAKFIPPVAESSNWFFRTLYLLPAGYYVVSRDTEKGVSKPPPFTAASPNAEFRDYLLS